MAFHHSLDYGLCRIYSDRPLLRPVRNASLRTQDEDHLARSDEQRARPLDPSPVLHGRTDTPLRDPRFLGSTQTKSETEELGRSLRHALADDVEAPLTSSLGVEIVEVFGWAEMEVVNSFL